MNPYGRAAVTGRWVKLLGRDPRTALKVLWCGTLQWSRPVLLVSPTRRRIIQAVRDRPK